MNGDARDQRLQADFEAMGALTAASTILDFQPEGEPPDRYTVTFRGKGLRRDASTDEVEQVDSHRCEIRLTLSYPRHSPDIRWLTPLFHPNISFGGFIRLRDIGVSWTDDLSLDVICERLWDVARLAYYDLENATNRMARSWLQKQCDVTLPVDLRPLRDRMSISNSNVMRYRRRDDKRVVLSDAEEEDEVLYIDEDTPVPPIKLASRDRWDDDDNVLYIGDE
jgi:hypothetical protein